MKYRLLHSEGSERLLLIFAGWGMDDFVFSGIRRPGYDVMVVWDYRTFHINWSFTEKYSEICLFAWSLGVYAASQTVQAIDHKITLRIAVNGTMMPIDDNKGIPENIYNSTHANLTEASLKKFFRRICSSKEDYELFMNKCPQRPVDELRDELQSVSDRLILDTPSDMRWDLAVIGRDDRIFPRYNQIRAWQDSCTVIRQVEKGHFFNFAEIIDNYIIDKNRVKQKFFNGAATYEKHATVQIDAVERLMKHIKSKGLIPAVLESKNAILEIGSGVGVLSRRIASLMGEAELYMWDIAADMPEEMPIGHKYKFRNCDAEIELSKVSPGYFDHIFSSSTIQWFNSPERFLADCYRALRADGCVFITTYTEGNMYEISDITKNKLPLLTVDKWLELAGKYFEIITWESYSRDLDFDAPLDVLRHLKMTGVNALGQSSRGTVDALEIIRRYPMRLDGRYHITYKPFIMVLRKK